MGLTWLLVLVMRYLPRRGRRDGGMPSEPPPRDPAALPSLPPEDPRAALGDSGLYARVPAHARWDRDRSSFREWLKRWILGRERVPIPSYIGVIEDPPRNGEPPRTGICCSGGGIRSAAFNLGALQELQEARRLQESKYLAAVSGGSYIAAAFSMVAKTPKPDTPEKSDDSDPELFTEGRPPFYHGSPEEQYLRNRSSYLAPGGSGRLRLVLRVALGLLVNLAFLTAGLVLIAWVLAIYYRYVHVPLQGDRGDAAAGTHTSEWLAAGAVAAVALLLGFISVFLSSTSDRTRRALETLTLVGLGIAVVILVIAVALPELVSFLRNQGVGRTPDQVTGDSAKGGVAVAATSGFGALLLTVLLELRSKLSIEDAGKALSWYRKLAAPVRRALTQIVAWIVGPLLLGCIMLAALVAMVSANHIGFWPVFGAGIVFFMFWLFSDVTSWSLHPFYRRRLCTAFALKRVKRPGKDAGDFGVAVERQYQRLVPLSDSGVEPGPGPYKTWPTLVVCAAANVSDPAATPPGRSVTSFTFSPVAIGGPLVGGVPTKAFEDHIAPARRRDFTLAAAVAMSGAAISPSMGKDTRRSIRFLLGLANVRLGVWVPNPRRTERWLESPFGMRSVFARVRKHDRGRVHKDTAAACGSAEGDRFRRWLWAPRAGPWYLIKEMCGWNSVNDPYLYVTDGGHYENLGLVELLRRGCTEVYCFDASGGTRLDALGDAIALARSELNVEIDELDPSPLTENPKTRLAKRCCVGGRIRYPNGVDGVLIYARNVVTEKAPYDVQAFRLRDKAFPHHSTLEQLYTDEKFEAYRELGAHAGRAAIEEAAKARQEAGDAESHTPSSLLA
jgi:hypothetical protein